CSRLDLKDKTAAAHRFDESPRRVGAGRPCCRVTGNYHRQTQTAKIEPVLLVVINTQSFAGDLADTVQACRPLRKILRQWIRNFAAISRERAGEEYLADAGLQGFLE